MTVYRYGAARVAASNAAGLIPLAAGRAAVAARELPDSGAIVRMTRSRIWIGVLGALLAGIVALNVLSLGLNASNGRVGEQINQLEQANSALRADIDEKLSSTRVEAAAATLGLATPGPEEISYIDYSDADVTRAARFLAGEIAAAADPQTASSGDYGTSSVASAPVAATVPAPSAAPAPSPSPAPAATASPAAPSSSTSPPASGTSGGGVSAGL
jgi:cell division septation protein DedD